MGSLCSETSDLPPTMRTSLSVTSSGPTVWTPQDRVGRRGNMLGSTLELQWSDGLGGHWKLKHVSKWFHSHSFAYLFASVQSEHSRQAAHRELVSWCFKSSQPQRIISGLRETFIKRYMIERTNKAEIRPVEQSEKAASCWEDLRNEIQLKGP